MKKDPRAYLGHILESIEQIEKYVVNLTPEEFLDNVSMQDAVIRRIQIIGVRRGWGPVARSERWREAGSRNFPAGKYA